MEEPFALVSKEFPIFNELTIEELALVEKYLRYKKLSKGSLIYKQGDHGNSVCFVVDGELDVILQETSGKKVLVARLKTGQAVGEMAIIDGLTRSASVGARTDSAVFILSRNDFNRIVNDCPEMGIKMLKGLARMLSANLRQTSNSYSKVVV